MLILVQEGEGALVQPPGAEQQQEVGQAVLFTQQPLSLCKAHAAVGQAEQGTHKTWPLLVKSGVNDAVS